MKTINRIFITLLTTAIFVFMASCSEKVKKGEVDSAKTMALLGLAVPAADQTAACMSCHSADTELGQNIRWAQSGWDASSHKNGTPEKIYGQVGTGVTGGPNTFAVIGAEFTGSNAFYANGGGCQVCHTNEGFIKKVQGKYAASTFDGSDKSSTWGTGSVDASKDYIGQPSPIGCFTCHAPHSQKDLKPRIEVANGTIVTTPAGAVYGSATESVTGQFRGALCANCHVARMGVGSSKNANGAAAALTSAKGTSISARLGPHHGPTTDMLLGKAGAEYAGKTYANGSHSSVSCTTCHFALPNATGDDFTALSGTSSLGGSNGLGGHSFNVKATIHGTEKINVNGCKASGCHSGTSAPASANVLATGTATVLGQSGFLRTGDAYITRSGLTTQWVKKISDMMSTLANPDKGCDGLIRRALFNKGGSVVPNWLTYPDGATLTGRCKIDESGYKANELANVTAGGATALTGVATVANTTLLTSKTFSGDAAATDTSDKTRIVKAIWNYNMVLKDKSWGNHNMKYALELLVDSCEDLAGLLGEATTQCAPASVPTRP